MSGGTTRDRHEWTTGLRTAAETIRGHTLLRQPPNNPPSPPHPSKPPHPPLVCELLNGVLLTLKLLLLASRPDMCTWGGKCAQAMQAIAVAELRTIDRCRAQQTTNKVSAAAPRGVEVGCSAMRDTQTNCFSGDGVDSCLPLPLTPSLPSSHSPLARQELDAAVGEVALLQHLFMVFVAHHTCCCQLHAAVGDTWR